MKVCPICHSQVSDESNYCTMCGNRILDDNQAVPYHPPVYQNAYQQPVYQQSAYNPYDHTTEFEAADIAQNKLFAIAMYLLSIVGILIALLGAKESAYVQFHLRQNLKFLIVEALLVLCAGLFAITIIVPIVAAVCLVIVEVLRVIAFFQVCNGKAKEPAIIRGLGFLK
ncbi:MAG: zinc ribbon domain-containing protein [Oscillospiraceae bacterium]|nr:zinc ribbon domain-containing protein [Oscillospiraceae bacterium]